MRSFSRIRRLALPALVLATFVGAGACGSDKPAAFPPHLDIPAAPAPAEPGSHAAGAQAVPESAGASTVAPPVADPTHPPAEPLTVPPEVSAIVDATDRTDADRQLDAGR